jgi:hypothetical protein
VRFQGILEEVGRDAASTSEDSTLSSSTRGVDVGEHLKSGDIDHAHEWNLAATLLHVLFVGMGGIAGADDEISIGFNKILSHEIERWTTILSGTIDTFVSIWHLGIEFDKRMNMVLVCRGPIHLGRLAEHHVQEIKSGLGTETTDDSTGKLTLSLD